MTDFNRPVFMSHVLVTYDAAMQHFCERIDTARGRPDIAPMTDKEAVEIIDTWVGTDAADYYEKWCAENE